MGMKQCHAEGLLQACCRLADMSLPTADAVRHAGDRHERLAEERHLPALHQEQQADPVVLAGASWALCHPVGLGVRFLSGMVTSYPKDMTPDSRTFIFDTFLPSQLGEVEDKPISWQDRGCCSYIVASLHNIGCQQSAVAGSQGDPRPGSSAAMAT